MAMVAKNLLYDKDIRALIPKNKRYKKAVGNPKELYIYVSPNGIKTFTLHYKYKGYDKPIKIKEFREGIIVSLRLGAMLPRY